MGLLVSKSTVTYPQVRIEVLKPVWIDGEPREIGWKGKCNEYDAQYMQNVGKVRIL